MRVDIGGSGSADAYAVIGDGRREVRILRAMAGKFDHGKLLRIPETPFNGQRGLKALARKLATLADKTVVSRYLALIDKEHVKDPDQVRRVLEEHGFTVGEIEQPVEGYLKIGLERGGKRIALHLSILGWEKSVEENLAKLIEALYGDRVEPSKEAVNRKLRELGLNDGGLAERAPKKALGEAFPALVKALEDLAGS